jgi:hypothetical protein
MFHFTFLEPLTEFLIARNVRAANMMSLILPLGFAGMKLLIDGKDVKSRIEKIQTQEKATKK